MSLLYNRYVNLIKRNIPSSKKKLEILIRRYWNDIQENYILNTYHDFNHIKMGLEELDETGKDKFEFFDELEYAYFYHDIIVGCRDAELLSTMVALHVRNTFKLILVSNIIADCIIETKFENLMNCHGGMFPELDVIHDMDLVILGKDYIKFQNYDDGIISENGPMFNKNVRIKILLDFYNNEKIYRTERFLDLYEKQARANIKKILFERYNTQI